jgi:hypothetical protein
MNLENVRMLELAAEHLDRLLAEVVFVGGATVELWITDEAAPEFRPTDDVDVIAEIATTRDFHRFEKRLRELGLENDQQSGVICRFRHPDSGLVLDLMPTEASILGFQNRWQGEAFPHAVEVALPSGRSIRAIPPPFLLATKLEAFKTRGKGDLCEGPATDQDSLTLYPQLRFGPKWCWPRRRSLASRLRSTGSIVANSRQAGLPTASSG